MPREDRRISNIKQDSINEINYYPSRQSVSEGDIIISHPKGKPLRLYKKLNGILWWSDFTRDGKQYFDNDLIYKGYLKNSNYPAFKAYVSTSADDQAIADQTRVRINFDAESYDVGGNYDTSAYKFTAPVAGIYHFIAKLLYDPDYTTDSGDWQSEDRHDIYLIKNDGNANPASGNIEVAKLDLVSGAITDNFVMSSVSSDLKLNAGDYIEVAVWQNSGVTQHTYSNNEHEWSAWTGHLITAI